MFNTFFVLFLTFCHFDNLSFAQSPELAKTHFEAAKSYYNQGKYEKALDEFQEAYRLQPCAEISYNIAQCYERLSILDKAIEYYKKYLDEKPDAKDAQAVKEKIESIFQRLEQTGIILTISENGARIFIDGQEVGLSPIEGMIKVTPGNHELKVEKEGFEKFTMKFSVAAGLQQSAEISLTPEKKVEAEKPKKNIAETEGEVKIEKTEEKTSKNRGMAGFYAGYGVGGALLIGGAITGALSLVNVEKANDNLNDTDTNNSYRDKAKKLALATDILLPAGAVAVIVTTIVLVIKKPWVKEKGEKEKKKTQGVLIYPVVLLDSNSMRIGFYF